MRRDGEPERLRVGHVIDELEDVPHQEAATAIVGTRSAVAHQLPMTAN
jgi:hypothetical protein